MTAESAAEVWDLVPGLVLGRSGVLTYFNCPKGLLGRVQVQHLRHDDRTEGRRPGNDGVTGRGRSRVLTPRGCPSGLRAVELGLPGVGILRPRAAPNVSPQVSSARHVINEHDCSIKLLASNRHEPIWRARVYTPAETPCPQTQLRSSTMSVRRIAIVLGV